jgi:hypothetical protein
MPWPLYLQAHSSQCPLNGRLDGLQNQFGYCGEEGSLLPLSVIEPWFFGCPACGLIAVLTDPSHLTSDFCTLAKYNLHISMIILLLPHWVNLSCTGSCHSKFQISHPFSVAFLLPKDAFNLKILRIILYSASFIELKNYSVIACVTYLQLPSTSGNHLFHSQL